MDPAAAAEMVGVRKATASLPGRSIDITLWYPAAPGGTPVLIGESAVFRGVPGQRDAPVAQGHFPLLVLSHGGIRSAPDLTAWIAWRLASQGFVVGAARGPRADDAQAAVAEISLRPGDLSAALTAMMEDPGLAGRLDTRRVGVLGFQLGGTAALALAGARLDADAYRRSCGEGGAGLDCEWLAEIGADLRSVDGALLSRSHLDPRVRAVVAVDPEGSTSFTSESLSEIAVPTEVISLGPAGETKPPLDASGLQGAIPGSGYVVVPEATPYSAFGACKPQGVRILQEEGESDAICRDHDGQTRESVQARLAALITAAFRRSLTPAQR
ncbi:alpha/beta hydrolase family protein [Arenibaculum pallidiluteum]|uniref:alpha/beta hydrolase family protein n=1 Tax=Arenibaculum pallidiluteum TaxID=2812559 RepID=UPI001A9696A2|nr:hypothetical protein [Arenibaculum pallidiluteum]